MKSTTNPTKRKGYFKRTTIETTLEEARQNGLWITRNIKYSQNIWSGFEYSRLFYRRPNRQELESDSTLKANTNLSLGIMKLINNGQWDLPVVSELMHASSRGDLVEVYRCIERLSQLPGVRSKCYLRPVLVRALWHGHAEVVAAVLLKQGTWLEVVRKELIELAKSRGHQACASLLESTFPKLANQ